MLLTKDRQGDWVQK